MADEDLIKTECYICMEPCNTKSPCSCACHVHPECLIMYIETSGHSECTICLGKYPIPPPPKTQKCVKRTCTALLLIALFFLTGFINSYFSETTYLPFSVNSFFTAITCYFILFLIWIFCRHKNSST